VLTRRSRALLATAGMTLLAAAGIVTGSDATAAELPVAVAPAPVTTDEDVAVQITLSGSDADGDELTFSIGSQPTLGTVLPQDPGQCTPVPPSSCNVVVTYTPADNAHGADSFTFTVSDGIDGTSDPATADITVTSVNDDPVAVDNDAAGLEDQPIDIFVLLNDTDVDGDLLSIDHAGDGAHGTVDIVGSGNNIRLQYTPDEDFNGFDSVSYTVGDGHGGTDTASVTIGVNPVNDPPAIIVPFAIDVDEDSSEPLLDPGEWSFGGYLDGDAGPPDEDATQAVDFVIDDVSPTSLFSVQPDVNPNGTLTFTLAPNANGVATVTAHATDTGGTADGGIDVGAPQEFTITVNPVNDAPSLSIDLGPTVDEDFSNAAQGFVSLPQFADGDPGPPDEDGTQAVDFVVDDFSNASLFASGPDINPNGTLRFKLAPNANGSSTVTAHAVDDGGTADGGLDESPGQQFTITVTPVNDTPDAVDDGTPSPVQILQNVGPTGIDVLSNDSTVDAGESLEIVSVTQGGHGSVAITGGGSGLTYDPAGAFTGTDTFTYTISDGVLEATATVHINVAADVTAPVTSIRVVGVAARTSTSLRVTVTWSAFELQSGVARYQLQQQTDGGAWSTITLAPIDATSPTLRL
jgi:large repetitive protein